MLAGKNRFHGHGSLRYLYANGRAIRTRFFTLKYTENKRRKTPRVAVVVSKKVFKGAAGRNHMRRRVYEYIRKNLDKIHPQTDIVVIISTSEVITLTAQELEKTLYDSLKQAGIYQ